MDHLVITDLQEQLRNRIRHRLQTHFSSNGTGEASAFTLPQSQHPLIDFISEHHLSDDETTMLLLALAPHLQANFFEPLIQEFMPQGGEFPEFGGMRSGNHRGLIPTGETALFVIAGNDFSKRITLQSFFSRDHLFAKKNLLRLEPVKDGEPLMS